MGIAMEEIEDVKEEMEKTRGSAVETLLHGARLAAGAYTLVRTLERYIEPRRALRFLRLYRRRSFWESAALFGAGAIAGAGIAMFVSPVSGPQTRQGMMRGVRNISRKGREMIQSAGSEIKEGIGRAVEQGQKGNGHEQRGREQPQT